MPNTGYGRKTLAENTNTRLKDRLSTRAFSDDQSREASWFLYTSGVDAAEENTGTQCYMMH